MLVDQRGRLHHKLHVFWRLFLSHNYQNLSRLIIDFPILIDLHRFSSIIHEEFEVSTNKTNTIGIQPSSDFPIRFLLAMAHLWMAYDPAEVGDTETWSDQDLRVPKLGPLQGAGVHRCGARNAWGVADPGGGDSVSFSGVVVHQVVNEFLWSDLMWLRSVFFWLTSGIYRLLKTTPGISNALYFLNMFHRMISFILPRFCKTPSFRRYQCYE